MKQVNNSRTIADLSEKELMDLIITLNKCMQDYDNDIEYRMKCSEKAEWESLKSNPNTVSQESLKKLYYAKKLKR